MCYSLKNTTMYSAIILASLLMSTTNLYAAPLLSNQLTKDPDAKLSIGINAVVTQSAYDTDGSTVEILPSAFFDNNRLYARGNQFGAYAINDGTNQLSAFVQTNGTAFDPEDAKGNLNKLDERKRTIIAGAEYLRITPIGGFRVQAAHDIVGDSKGNIARLNYVAKYSNDRLTLYPTIGVEWHDRKYNDYYYGVSQKESKNSGVNTYEPDQSISPYLAVSAHYDINDHFTGFAYQSLTYLADEQYNSPMVDSHTEAKTTVGLLYKF
ncbi:MipA/OmpV family protein [Psychrobacter sp. I-STPA10]|uniref:MipA/OmpV family protein n=1 Tax=Psychrobacter sp. I-STPA10 TaxID=2585769 RepID=UPI001E347CE4|nr:MipA/OmpV family protein [Psychrobacter sp. I-STPA10]